MEKYIPDLYQKSIYAINYDKLLERGIKCLLFDLDNTLVAVNVKRPTKRLKNLFKDIKEMGFTVILFSNSPKFRLRPFKEELEVDCCALANKPNLKKFQMIMNEYHFNESQVAIIGDQIMTDILGGNRAGITTILVNPVSNKDGLFTKINRFREKKIMRKLREKELFTKGKYYDE